MKSYDIYNECFDSKNYNSTENNSIKLEGCNTCCNNKKDIYTNSDDLG